MWRTDCVLGYIYAAMLMIQKGTETFKHHCVFIHTFIFSTGKLPIISSFHGNDVISMEIDRRGFSVHKGITDLYREDNHAYAEYLRINGCILY